MSQTAEETNKRLVLEAFDMLFNKRDYKAPERFWSPNYIQHSAHIAPGREGLFSLVRSLPAELRYEVGPIVADGKFVIIHRRFSGTGLPLHRMSAPIRQRLRHVHGVEERQPDSDRPDQAIYADHR